MADKNVQLKNGNDNLYPVTTAANVEGIVGYEEVVSGYTVVVTLGGSMLYGSGRTFAVVNGTDTYVSDGQSETYTLTGVQTIQFFAHGETSCHITSTTLGLNITGRDTCESSIITLTQDVNDVSISGNF